MTTELSQGDIIKMNGFKNAFLIVSNNAFIQSTGMAHVCPMLLGVKAGPVHIPATGISGTTGTVICEQLKLIDFPARAPIRIDRLSYGQIMNVSDVLQGIFEYD